MGKAACQTVPGLMSKVMLEIERPAVWPTALREYLEAHHDLFLGWESGSVVAAAYDRAVSFRRP